MVVMVSTSTGSYKHYYMTLHNSVNVLEFAQRAEFVSFVHPDLLTKC